MEHVPVDKEIKKIDKWVGYIIRHAYIKTIIFVVAILEAIFLPLLPEIIVAGALTYRKNLSWKLLSIISACGSVVGISILYMLGRFLYVRNEVFFDSFLHGGGYITTVTQEILHNSAFVVIFLSAVTPLPDRILAFISGVLSVPFFIVILAFFLIRLLRVGVVAYFSHKFGELARSYILKHSRWAAVGIVVIVLIYIYFKIH
jgi:membrane protein YqaA with SNARE-associated domain